jgi:hypothetical protein
MHYVKFHAMGQVGGNVTMKGAGMANLTSSQIYNGRTALSEGNIKSRSSKSEWLAERKELIGGYHGRHIGQ